MIESEFKGLVHLYQGAIGGRRVGEQELLMATASFLENLKCAFQEGNVVKAEALVMLEFLRRIALVYDTHMKKSPQRMRQITSKDQEKLKSKVQGLIADLHLLFEPSSVIKKSRLEATSKSRKRQKRMHERKWIRS